MTARLKRPGEWTPRAVGICLGLFVWIYQSRYTAIMFSDSEFSGGNTIRVLHDAAETYPAMLAAIEGARHSVYLANYCMIRGRAFDRFHEVLMAAAQRGVDVRILLDAYGSKDNDPAQIQALRDAGAKVAWFQPFHPLQPHRYNRRLHKKLMIVDNKIGFTGGIGVRDYWLQHPDYPAPWRDTHFQLEGPIVADMIGAFARSWNPWGSSPLPKVKPPAQSTESGGVEIAAIDSHPIGLTRMAPIGPILLELITSAQHDITITTGYFGPNRAVMAALCQATSRGVDVRLLTNSRYSTHHFVLEAGKPQYAQLLRGGVRIYEYQPTMVHAKLVIVDGKTSCIGSANLNCRSLYHSQEFNLLVRGRALASQLNQDFERDLEQAQEIKLPAWRRRPLATKLRQALYSPSHYLF